MGSGGNFAKRLTIDTEGNLTGVKGPLDASDDKINIALYVWVVQTRHDGSGAAFTSELDEAGIVALPARLRGLGEAEAQWIVPGAETGETTAGNPSEQKGRFETGPATGVALTVAKAPPDGPRSVTWWTDTITLEEAKPKDGATGV